jgi:hypothetical protein
MSSRDTFNCKGVYMMMNKVVVSLRREYSRLEREMGQVGKALDALGHAGGKKLKTTGRTLSKDARRRIAEAQRLRWAKVRKAAAKLAKS